MSRKAALPFIIAIFALPVLMVILKPKPKGIGKARITYEPVATPVAENSEEWQIIRNDKGRLDKIIVKRTVRDLR